MSFLPAPREIVKETICMLIATLAVAFIISRVPAARSLVRGNSINPTQQ
jgi:signal peptidase I